MGLMKHAMVIFYYIFQINKTIMKLDLITNKAEKTTARNDEFYTPNYDRAFVKIFKT